MKYIIFYAILFFTTQVHAWVINADFEKGQVGSGEAQGPNAFGDAFSNTVYTKELVHEGSLAAVTSIKKGDTAFGKWGGKFKFPKELAEGDQVWLRVWFYYPAGFDFTTGSIGLKTLRIHTKSSDGSNDGYFDMLTNGSSGITFYNEPMGSDFYKNNPEWKKLGPSVNTGQWHAYEQYVKFSSKSGNGIYRGWLNGKLIFEDTKSPTLKSSSSLSDSVYIWSYFNGGSPKDQKAYVDDIIITNEIPDAVDSAGNRFIGVGNSSFTSPPKPPKLLN